MHGSSDCSGYWCLYEKQKRRPPMLEKRRDEETRGEGDWRKKNQHWITECFLCTTWSLSLGGRRVCLCVCLHVCVCGCACKWMEVLKSHRYGADPVSSARRLTAACLPPSRAKSVWHVCTDTHFVSDFLLTVPYTCTDHIWFDAFTLDSLISATLHHIQSITYFITFLQHFG